MRLFIAVSLMLLASSVSAQSLQMTPQMCSTFATDRVMDTRNYMSAEYNYNRTYNMLCRSSESNNDTRFNLAASVTNFIGGVAAPVSGALDFSSKRSYADNVCKQLEKMSEEQRRVAFASQSYSDNMRDATLACLNVVRDMALQRTGLFAYAAPDNSHLTEYVVTFEAKPNPIRPISLKAVGGDNIRCKYANQEQFLPLEVNVNGPLVFHCEKHTDEGSTISFHTEEMGDTHVRLPGKSDMAIVALQARVDALSRLQAMQAERRVILDECDFPAGSPYNIVGIGWGVESITNMWNRMDHPVKADCPAGQVVVGIHSGHHNGYEDRQFRYKCCTVKLSD
jgi:hypothetical protein